jgi:hypothetical protein
VTIKQATPDPDYFFDCYGPFDLRHSARRFSGDKKYLRDALEACDDGLACAIGCYLFGIRYGGKITPWYAGMTVAEGGFISEVLQEHKRENYAQAMAQQQRGAPVLFLFPLLTYGEKRFSHARSSGKRVSCWLERALMGLAYGQNPEISNLRDMHFLRNVEVLGLLGPKRPGRPFKEAKETRRTLLGHR